MKAKTLLALSSLLLANLTVAGEPWRFLLLADWHAGEKYVLTERNPEWLAKEVAEDLATVKMLKADYGGELILMPGDAVTGHWERPGFIKNNCPGATPEESVLKAGSICYSSLISVFRKGGYSKLIMAVGDHEVGDNPWQAGSAVSRCQPQFREAFAKEFNRNPDGGGFLYDAPIGKAASRPLGTKYEETSYALRHKNVLFVTVDAFHQEDPNKNIGDEGTVTGTVTGEHLEWLDQVLSEARKDAGIKHIFVQSHLPVIYPVRKVNSSGMLIDDGTENPFWKTLRKYKVDIYFAGEVHANTVTKDPESDLVQLVSRGNLFNNFQTLDIYDERIEVTCYNQTGEKTSDGQYEVSGQLLIDKSGATTRIQGNRELAVLDPAARMFHFDFEEKEALADRQIMGMMDRHAKSAGTLRGVVCNDLVPNRGAFGPHYSAVSANIRPVDGIRGKAGQFNENSRMGVFAMGPHHSGHVVSYALWVKTDATERQLLINSGSMWSPYLKEFLNLNLNNGVPEVMISDKQWLSAEGVRLNDGQWHHIAVSMPSHGCLLSEVELYVDGKPMKTRVTGADKNLFFHQAVRMGFGGLNYSQKAFDQLPVKSFTGAMDEVSIWARSLTREDVMENFRGNNIE